MNTIKCTRKEYIIVSSASSLYSAHKQNTTVDADGQLSTMSSKTLKLLRRLIMHMVWWGQRLDAVSVIVTLDISSKMDHRIKQELDIVSIVPVLNYKKNHDFKIKTISNYCNHFYCKYLSNYCNRMFSCPFDHLP